MRPLATTARRVAWCALSLLLIAGPATAGQRGIPMSAPDYSRPPKRLSTDDARLERLVTWLRAVDQHQPGVVDTALDDVAGWNLPELQGLWLDIDDLVRLMRSQSGKPRFFVTKDGVNDTEVIYSEHQLQLLTSLACVAGGYLEASNVSPVGRAVLTACIERRAADYVHPERFTQPALREFGQRFGALIDQQPGLPDIEQRFRKARLQHGNDNGLLKRAALLHSDIVMLKADAVRTPWMASLPVGPRRVRLESQDGRGSGVATDVSGIHWQIAEMVLDHVTPGGGTKPAPETDPGVALWYRATTMWMQAGESYDPQHLDRALDLFPVDAEIRFLAGCQYEAFATPSVQEGIRRLTGPRDRLYTLAPRASESEWRRAASAFKTALKTDPAHAQASLHLGRVLGLLGEHEDAVTTLRPVLPALERSPLLHYYGALFLGDAEERLSRFDLARESFERARSLFPRAQKPLLALSQLAWRRDAHGQAAAAMADLFGRQTTVLEDDPWASYATSHTLDTTVVVERAWQMMRSDFE